MFLPHQPYAMAGGLRDHLLYGLDRSRLDDARLEEILAAVGLLDVVARVGGLDAEGDWPNTLSEGELQVFAIARLLAANPRFAFLDQATAVLDHRREELLYAALARTNITYVSIGDHPALFKYHDARLDLHGDGAWTMSDVDARP
jgi:putative ATP-binding cassette transporter